MISLMARRASRILAQSDISRRQSRSPLKIELARAKRQLRIFKQIHSGQAMMMMRDAH